MRWIKAARGAEDHTAAGRITDASSTADDAITTAVGAASGLSVDVGNSVMPTLGAPHHEISAQGGTTDVAVHETWMLPPVVTLQHRPLSDARSAPMSWRDQRHAVLQRR